MLLLEGLRHQTKKQTKSSQISVQQQQNKT
jgi:hypothetical protein